MNAAQAIAAALKTIGLAKQIEQARIVGEHPVAWGYYIRGGRVPSVAKLERWVLTAGERGYALAVLCQQGTPGYTATASRFTPVAL